MQNRRRLLSFLGCAAILLPLVTTSAPVVPLQGGAALVLEKPVFLTGIRSVRSDSTMASYAADFPPTATAEHFAVVNAGYWIANQGKPSQVFFELTLTVTNPFEARVYTRVVLDNPADQARPITYEHHLDPREKSTQVTHGPLSNVKRGQKYQVVFESFADESRSVLLERVVQALVAPLDNTSGCVELGPDLMLFIFPQLRSSQIPIEKVALACDR